jgi:hypothetical protein
MSATTNDYALIVEKEFEAPGYRIMVSPVGRILRMVAIHYPNWEETARALMTHAHYTEQSIQQCEEILKNGEGHQVDRIVLTDEEAEALGWAPEFNTISETANSSENPIAQ